MKSGKHQGKRHVIALVRNIDGLVGITFCGRIAGPRDSESWAEVVAKIEGGRFRRELHCQICMRALEFAELVRESVLAAEGDAPEALK